MKLHDILADTMLVACGKKRVKYPPSLRDTRNATAIQDKLALLLSSTKEVNYVYMQCRHYGSIC